MAFFLLAATAEAFGMAIVVINRAADAVDYAVSTWGELLERLDEQCAPGHVVAAVRINGVEEATFRSADVLTIPLDADAEVLVETARPADLIGAALDEAETVSATILARTLSLSAACRGHNPAGSNQGLADCASSLGWLVAFTSTVARAADVDLDVAGVHSGSELFGQLTVRTNTLLSAHEQGDWTSVADVLEHDLAGIIRRWPLVLQGIREAALPQTHAAV
jgi:hypothetical protein